MSDIPKEIFIKIIEELPISVVLTTGKLEKPHPIILYVNKKFEEVTGYSKDEAVGQSPRILQGPETEVEMRKKLKKDLEESGFFHASSATNYKKNGEKFIFEWDIISIEVLGEKYYVGFQKDITNIYSAAHELQEIVQKINLTLK